VEVEGEGGAGAEAASEVATPSAREGGVWGGGGGVEVREEVWVGGGVAGVDEDAEVCCCFWICFL